MMEKTYPLLRIIRPWMLAIIIPLIFQLVSFNISGPDRHSEKTVFQGSNAVIFSDAAAGAENFLGLAGEVVNDDFSVDPRGGPAWKFTKGWRWKEGVENCCVATLKTRKRTGRWVLSTFSYGILSARVKLVASSTTLPPRGGLIFAFNPDDGSFRYVILRAGNPGRIIFGQKGTIDGWLPFKKTVKVGRVRKKRWHDLDVEILEGAGVNIYLAGELVLNDGAVPAASGQLGVRSVKSSVHFDDFSFVSCTGPSPASDCRECHDGDPPEGYELAPNVMTYWDGSWWDDNHEGNGRQQGGHGDPDGKPPVDCAGAVGCHDLTQSRCTHTNGVIEGRDNPTENTYHLRRDFFTPDTSVAPGPWSVQVTFDNFCYNACHPGAGRRDMRHERDSWEPGEEPEDPPILYDWHWSVELGTHLSRPDGESLPYPVDSDLTNLASTEEPDFAPCITCHDPHGTSTEDTNSGDLTNATNHMLRDDWSNELSTLCKTCH